MNNLLKLAMLVFGVSFLLVSCEKEATNYTTEALSQNDNPTAFSENDDDVQEDDVMYSYFYFIDNLPVDEEYFIENKVDEYTYAEDDETSTELDRIINVKSYTTNELLVEFDSEKAVNIAKVTKFEVKAQALDEDSDNYEEELDKLHKKIFGEDEGRWFVTQMYDFCMGEGNNPFTSMIRSRWNLWSFQNRIEMVRFLGVRAGVVLYDRSRFRRRMVIMYMWGFTNTCVPNFTRNRANSTIRI